MNATRRSITHHTRFDPRLGDAALAVLVVAAFAVAALAFGFGEEGSATGRSTAVAIVAAGSLAARRVSPPAVLAIVIAGRLFVTWDVGNELAPPRAATAKLRCSR